MNNLEPLARTSLTKDCSPQQFSFETTAELNHLEEIIGQARALEAIATGMEIDSEGFNIFALGPNGTGKYTAVRQFLEARAADRPVPDDWCYVYNFDEPHQPRALRLPPGRGAELRADMARLVEGLQAVLPAAFSSEEYQTQKRALETEAKEQEDQALEGLRQEALSNSIGMLRTPFGFVFAPLKESEVVGPDEFLQMPEEEQQRIEKEVERLHEALRHIVFQAPQRHRELQEQLKQLREDVAARTVQPLFDEVRQGYEGLLDVLNYLETVQADVIANVGRLLDDAEGSEDGSAGAPGLETQRSQPLVSRYQVNVIVEHQQAQGAPVLYEDQPSYLNLIGRVEHVAHMGALLTDFNMIRPGALHRANGGYLILDARRLLLQPFSWEALKQALRSDAIRIESPGQVYSLISTVALEPEPIPLDVKVVLLGDRELYYLLAYYDPDFDELFKVAADFEDEMPRTADNVQAYAYLLATIARKEELHPLDRGAVARVVEHSARLCGDGTKLTTHMQSISDLLREANLCAKRGGRDLICTDDVQDAVEAQVRRLSRVRERLQEATLRQAILIDTEGSVVGQVNGLSVYALGKMAFGRPSRITALVRPGKGEVLDIEREVEMGGPVHSKGVLILGAFLAARYAAGRPFSLSASLVFEQSYGGVEGDSASLAELCALLSALSLAPIRQSLAVTGSVNQRGQVQAIGGVNEKVEGFFDLCQARGLTGEQGVIIPAANVEHLMLRRDVVNAASMGRFKVYAVDTVDEAITLLAGLPAGEADDEGNYPEGTVNARVVARLATLADIQREERGKVSANGQREEVADGATVE